MSFRALAPTVSGFQGLAFLGLGMTASAPRPAIASWPLPVSIRREICAVVCAHRRLSVNCWDIMGSGQHGSSQATLSPRAGDPVSNGAGR